MNTGSLFSQTVILSALFCSAQSQGAPATPPGVPEPGLVIWGSVVNKTNTAQFITISSASWSVTDGTKTVVFSAGTIPPTRIVTLGDRSFYVVEIPFDTRRFGNISLADPATVNLDSFELKSASPPTYTLTPTINGVLATVQAVDGAPSSGANFPVAGFTSAIRGRVIRVDLAAVPLADDYDSWAAGFFGSASLPQAARTADPDGDGLNNEAEHAAGTDPTNAGSVLRILTITVDDQGDKAVLDWRSVADKRYIIESATNAEGPWIVVGNQVPGAAQTTQANVPVAPGDALRFYRIRLAP